MLNARIANHLAHDNVAIFNEDVALIVRCERAIELAIRSCSINAKVEVPHKRKGEVIATSLELTTLGYEVRVTINNMHAMEPVTMHIGF